MSILTETRPIRSVCFGGEDRAYHAIHGCTIEAYEEKGEMGMVP